MVPKYVSMWGYKLHVFDQPNSSVKTIWVVFDWIQLEKYILWKNLIKMFGPGYDQGLGVRTHALGYDDIAYT